MPLNIEVFFVDEIFESFTCDMHMPLLRGPQVKYIILEGIDVIDLPVEDLILVVHLTVL